MHIEGNQCVISGYFGSLQSLYVGSALLWDLNILLIVTARVLRHHSEG